MDMTHLHSFYSTPHLLVPNFMGLFGAPTFVASGSEVQTSWEGSQTCDLCLYQAALLGSAPLWSARLPQQINTSTAFICGVHA